MSTTLASLRTMLNEDYVRDPKDKIWNQATKNRALNKWYIKVQQELNWNADPNEAYDTRSSVAGSELYDLPDDFVRLSLVRYDWEELTRTTRKTVREFDDNPQSGKPEWYYIYNGKLWLYPVPNSVKTIDLYYLESILLSTSNDSELPTYCDDAIVLWAAYKLYIGVRDMNSAQIYAQDFQDEIRRLRSTMLMNDENMSFGYDLYGSRPREDVLYY